MGLALSDVSRQDNPTLSRIMAQGAGHHFHLLLCDCVCVNECVCLCLCLRKFLSASVFLFEYVSVIVYLLSVILCLCMSVTCVCINVLSVLTPLMNITIDTALVTYQYIEPPTGGFLIFCFLADLSPIPVLPCLVKPARL